MDLRRLFDDLVRLETELWNGVDACLRAECGTSLGGFDVLRVIDAHPLCRVYDVAAALAITVGGASQAVDRLERRGECARGPHPSDRRSSIVSLTPAGRATLDRAGAVFDRELAAWFGTGATPAALRRLGETLAALRAANAARTAAP